MKIAIIFYSFSGNTREACSFLQERLKSKGHQVEVRDLKPIYEEKDFFKQCRQAFLKQKLSLEPVNYDVGEFDVIIFSSPVWAFTVTPTLKSYLAKIKNLEGKKVACVLTHGSGLGSKKALKELDANLREMKAQVIFTKSIPGVKVKSKTFLEKRLGKILTI